ncbi:MAG: hypothetical protein ACHQDY_09230 [Solirubrobacterales bacterium]
MGNRHPPGEVADASAFAQQVRRQGLDAEQTLLARLVDERLEALTVPEE